MWLRFQEANEDSLRNKKKFKEDLIASKHVVLFAWSILSLINTSLNWVAPNSTYFTIIALSNGYAKRESAQTAGTKL